ncbi:hypothetical protein ACHAXT_007301 [Thalassiosira profunda]
MAKANRPKEPRPGLLIDISARLQVMRGQESAHYKVPDYLAAEWQRKLREAAEGRDEDCVARAAAKVKPPAQTTAPQPANDSISPSSPSPDAPAEAPSRDKKRRRSSGQCDVCTRASAEEVEQCEECAALDEEEETAEYPRQRQRRLEAALDEAAPQQVDQGAANAPGSNAADANANDANADAADGASTETPINAVWREKICEWCYQVVDHYDFHREVVAVALSYLDRYLATRAVNRRIFQLAAMTALYLAIKLYEPGKLRLASLIELSRGYFLAEHIVIMEDSILQSLGWHVHPPTSFAFVRDLVRLLPEDVAPAARHDVAELARFLTELSVCDYGLAKKRPSSVALACIVNAVELQGSRRVRPDHKDEFLRRVVELGLYEAGDPEIHECWEKIREAYIAGGYAPATEDEDVPVASPTEVADGPDAKEGHMECV